MSVCAGTRGWIGVRRFAVILSSLSAVARWHKDKAASCYTGANNTKEFTPRKHVTRPLFNAVHGPSGIREVNRSVVKAEESKPSMEINSGWFGLHWVLFCFFILRVGVKRGVGSGGRSHFELPPPPPPAALLSLLRRCQPLSWGGPSAFVKLSIPSLMPPPSRARAARRPTLFPGEWKTALNCRLTAKGKLFQA